MLPPSTPRPEDTRLEEVLFYQIEQAMRQSIRYTHRIFTEAAVDLTKDQWLIVKKINDNVVTRMLDILERKQLLTRQPNPADRRSSLIVPTPAGTKIYQQVLPLVKAIRAEAIAGFTPTELAQFRSYLNRIRVNLE